jgi:hypothetical protein
MANTNVLTVDLLVEGQPECCARLCEQGWKFKYDEDAGFVLATHPMGGKKSIVEVMGVHRLLSFSPLPIAVSDSHEIGRQIAMLLNGGNHRHKT